jgi:hypothetical protein
MRGGNFVQEAAREQIPEILITDSSRRRFQTEMAPGRLGGSIRGKGVQGQAMQASQIGDELLVGIGIAAANLVVHVDQREDYAEFVAKFQQQPQESNGVGTARDRHAHSVAGAEQFQIANIAKDALSQLVHTSMVLHPELVPLSE